MSDEQLNNKVAEMMKESIGFLIRKILMFVVATCGTAVIAGVVFYFSTTATLARHSSEIQDLRESKAQSETVQSIKGDIKEIKDKQEKMFNYLLEKKDEKRK